LNDPSKLARDIIFLDFRLFLSYCATFVLTAPYQPLEIQEFFKGYKKENNTNKMSEATVMFIESIFEGKELIERISSFLGKLFQGVDEIAKKIPEFLKADKELLEQMSHNMKETDENLKK
jgi:hypothetical protein